MSKRIFAAAMAAALVAPGFAQGERITLREEGLILKNGAPWVHMFGAEVLNIRTLAAGALSILTDRGEVRIAGEKIEFFPAEDDPPPVAGIIGILRLGSPFPPQACVSGRWFGFGFNSTPIIRVEFPEGGTRGRDLFISTRPAPFGGPMGVCFTADVPGKYLVRLLERLPTGEEERARLAFSLSFTVSSP